MPPSQNGPVLFVGSGPYRISQETRGNIFAHSCLAFLRENSIPFVVMDIDASGPLAADAGGARLINAPFDARSIAAAIDDVKPSRVWPICAGKEVQALFVRALDEAGRADALPGGARAYNAAADWAAFRALAAGVDVEVPFGRVVTSIEAAAAVAGEVGFPLFLSASGSTGGGGARIVYNYEELAAQTGTLLSWSLSSQVLVVRVHEKHPQCEVHILRDARGGSAVLGISDALTPLGVHVANATNVFPARRISPASGDAVAAAAARLAEEAGLVGYAVVHFGLDGDRGVYAVGMRLGFAASSYLVSLALGVDVARAATAVAFGAAAADAAGPLPGTHTAVSSPRFDNSLFPGSGESVGPYKISSGAGVGLAPAFADAFLAAASSARVARDDLFRRAAATSRDGGILPLLAAPRTEFLADVLAAIMHGHSVDEIVAASGMRRVYVEELALLVDARKGSPPDAPPSAPSASAAQSVIRRDSGAGKTFIVVGPPARGVGEVDPSDVFLRGLAKAYLARGYRLVFASWQSQLPLDLFFLAAEIHLAAPAESLTAALASADVSAGCIVWIDQRNRDWETLARQALAAGAVLAGASPDDAASVHGRKSLAGLLPRVGLAQKESEEVADADQAARAADAWGYPVILQNRGGEPRATVAYDRAELDAFVNRAGVAVIVERFLPDLVESAVLVLSDGRNARAAALIEVLEETGITVIDRAGALPPSSFNEQTRQLLSSRAEALVAALGLRGVVTVRLGLRYDVPYFLSVTAFPSRELHFAAFAAGADSVGAAAAIYEGASLDEAWPVAPAAKTSRVFVRQPVFSFGRFPGSDTLLTTRARSTGDVIGEGASFSLAFANARRAAGRPLPLSGTVFVSLRDRDKQDGMTLGRRLTELGFRLASTDGTARALASAGVHSRVVYRVSEGRPNVIDLIKNREITLVIYTPAGGAPRDDEVQIRTVAWSLGVPVITTAGEALAAVGAIKALKGS